MTEIEALRLRLMHLAQPEPNSGCLIWLGDLNKEGYATYSTTLMDTKLVHRMMFRIEHGFIPAWLTLDHTCRVRCCINLDHLELTSHGENSRRVHKRRRA